MRLEGAAPPPPLSAAAGALLLILADRETPVWLAADVSGSSVPKWLTFHTNAALVVEADAAVYAVGSWAEIGEIGRFAIGTPEHPDRSTTLVVEVPQLRGGASLRLSGPGVSGSRLFSPELPADAAEALASNHARFPLGVDVFFTSGCDVAALPRSTKVEH